MCIRDSLKADFIDAMRFCKGHKILPEQLVMAIADAAENPGTMNLIGIGMSIPVSYTHLDVYKRQPYVR